MYYDDVSFYLKHYLEMDSELETNEDGFDSIFSDENQSPVDSF